jgi:uncharacterized protein YecT (DUF1311 family)
MRVVVFVVVLSGGVAASAWAGGGHRPPVIHESFTVLPCPAHPKSRLDFEGCKEKALLSTDRAINGRARRIFGLLRTRSARSAFVRGEQSWLRYRRSSCSAQASVYSGGSEEPNAFAQCEVDRNRTHLTELAEMERWLRQH